MKLKEQTNLCNICLEENNKINLIYLFNKENICCLQCIQKKNAQFIKYKIHGVECLSIYLYNDELKQLIYRLKGCYDIELAKSFLYPYLRELKLFYKSFNLVPIPSNSKDDQVRGFNHVLEIFKCLNLPILQILEKKNNVKQSDRNFNQRQLIIYDLKVNDLERIENKNILIVDDICTTGNTLKAVISLLKEGKPKKIKVLTICIVQKKI